MQGECVNDDSSVHRRTRLRNAQTQRRRTQLIRGWRKISLIEYDFYETVNARIILHNHRIIALPEEG